jgi:hypothetical protein
MPKKQPVIKISVLSTKDINEIKKLESKLGVVLIAYDKEQCIHGHRYCILCQKDEKNDWRL